MSSHFIRFRDSFRARGSARAAALAARFFKTGPGEYGEGDRFLGIKVPVTRSFLAASDALTEADVLKLLRSPWHEERLLALLILVRRFQRDEAARAHLMRLYLANTRWVNNWDLVDSSAPQLLGAWLLGRDRSPLRRLARSKNLWEQRIAIVATHAFIRVGDIEETKALCEYFLTHRHDLIHKACGWMLREMGKVDEPALTGFLDRHAPRLPRTMLRYAIERLTPEQRRRYMQSA